MKKICIKPTLKCNYNCPTCQERRNLHRNIFNDKQLNYNDWIKILNESAELGVNDISISGAEPLFYNKLIGLINTCRNLNFKRIGINTNASMLTQQQSDDLFDSGLTCINISLTNFTNKEYMKAKGITNKNALKNTLDNIYYFNKHKTKNISSNDMIFLTKLNLFKLPEIFMRAKFLCFDTVSVDVLEGNWNDDTYKITNDDIKLFEDKYLNKIDERFRYRIGQLLDRLKNNIYKDYSICDIPGNFCIILANGDLHPCNILEYTHEECINLFDYDISLIKAMRSDYIKNFIVNKSNYCDVCQINVGENFLL